MQRTVLSIVGPTATGKSKLALLVAEELVSQGLFEGVDIISADSRQVYKGIEIVSGADIPDLFELSGSIKLNGVALLEPDETWSLADFQKFALEVIESSWSHSRLPIVVGGTGLYHQQLFNDELRQRSGPNPELRKKYAKFSVEELQAELQKSHSETFAKMTHSDQQNPRRLIRLLEQVEGEQQVLEPIKQPDTHLWFGLTAPKKVIEDKIAQRVQSRIDQGAVAEVAQLRNSVSNDAAVFSATGVAELLEYLNKKCSLDEAIQGWIIRERQYAKRQLTWWRKFGDEVKWFDITEKPPERVVTEINNSFLADTP